jgi:hypothetical protein
MSQWKWIKVTPDSLPPDGVLVEVKSVSGGESKLTLKDKMWWAGDMYVYYDVAYWRPIG